MFNVFNIIIRPSLLNKIQIPRKDATPSTLDTDGGKYCFDDGHYKMSSHRSIQVHDEILICQKGLGK